MKLPLFTEDSSVYKEIMTANTIKKDTQRYKAVDTYKLYRNIYRPISLATDLNVVTDRILDIDVYDDI